LSPRASTIRLTGAGLPGNKTELREGPLAAAAQLRPDGILCIAQDADENVAKWSPLWSPAGAIDGKKPRRRGVRKVGSSLQIA
jgi:hypothetical protein